MYCWNRSNVRSWITCALVCGCVLLGDVPSLSAQVQHPLAARRLRAHRVHERRENVAEVRQDRAENVAGRRAAAAARAVLPRYAPATLGPAGAIVLPPVTVTAAPPITSLPAATVPAQPATDANEYEGLPSDALTDVFSGSTSYPVIGIEDGGVTVVLKMGDGQTRVRMVGVAAVTLGERVNLPERLSGIRLPSTETFVNNLLKGERVYVVYDTQVAEEDADGKCVAYLFRAPDGLLVNLEVVRAGFAVTQSGYEFDQKSLFEKYQASAQAAGKGIYGIIRRLRN